jgi:hypothetical protein
MATVLQMTASYIVAGDFDSRNRYLRAGNPSADFPIAKGKTFFITTNTTSLSSTQWRYSAAGWTLNHPQWTGGSLAASYTLVTT